MHVLQKGNGRDWRLLSVGLMKIEGTHEYISYPVIHRQFLFFLPVIVRNSS